MRELQAITAAATARNPDATWAACEAHVRSAAGVAMGLLRSAADNAGTA